MAMTPGSSKIPVRPKNGKANAKTLKVGSGSKKGPAIKGNTKAK